MRVTFVVLQLVQCALAVALMYELDGYNALVMLVFVNYTAHCVPGDDTIKTIKRYSFYVALAVAIYDTYQLSDYATALTLTILIGVAMTLCNGVLPRVESYIESCFEETSPNGAAPTYPRSKKV